MAVRQLRIYPDPVLRQRCRRVTNFDAELHRLMDDLAESMYAYQGVGLAAPQIGELWQAIVVDVEQREGERRIIELVNPQVVETSAELREFEEGCLSFPGEAEMVSRPARVKVTGQDRRGGEVTLEADGLLAVALQHEIDHLEGKLFIDRISRLKRSLIDKRLRKKARQAAG